MARVTCALQQLFEVVGEADEVEFAQAVRVVDARWVDVPVDDSIRVQVGDGAGELSENAEGFLRGIVVLAELLPCRDMVWRFRFKN